MSEDPTLARRELPDGREIVIYPLLTAGKVRMGIGEKGAADFDDVF